MSTGSDIQAVEKRQYRNNTLGWLGVVILSPQGEEVGISVEPQGTVWLSDAEAICTARAPRDPKDNPFEEQAFMEIVPGSEPIERKIRPLVPISESRFVPAAGRYLPPGVGHADAPDTAAAAVNATGDEPGHATAAGDPVAEAEAAVMSGIPTAGEAARVVPAMEARSEPAATVGTAPAASGTAMTQPGGTSAEAQHGSWTEPPGGVTHARGELAGENAPEEEKAAPPTAPAPPPPNPGQANDQTVVSSSGEEETAAQATPEQEETGAAVPPAGEPTEGEFAQHEEVGTPDAPAAQARTESA